MTPLVEKALNAVTIGTNLSSGLSYPSDMNRAKEMFVRLHKAGEKLLADRNKRLGQVERMAGKRCR